MLANAAAHFDLFLLMPHVSWALCRQGEVVGLREAPPSWFLGMSITIARQLRVLSCGHFRVYFN